MAATIKLCNAFLDAHPIDSARMLEAMPEKSLGRFLSKLRPGAAASAMEHTDPGICAASLQRMTPRAAARIADAFHLDFRVPVLRQIPPKHQKLILGAMSEETADQTRRLLRYPEGTIGALMEPYALTLPQDVTAAEALSRIRRTRRRIRFYVYVLDRR